MDVLNVIFCYVITHKSRKTRHIIGTLFSIVLLVIIFYVQAIFQHLRTGYKGWEQPAFREVIARYHLHPAALLWPTARGVILPLLPRGFNYPGKWLSEPVSSVSLLSVLATPF